MKKLNKSIYFALLLNLVVSFSAYSLDFNRGKNKLPFEAKVEVKESKIKVKSKTEVVLTFKIDKDSYIYKESVSFKINNSNGLKVGKPIFPKAEKKLDKFSGTQKEIYHNSLSVRLPIEALDSVKQGKSELDVTIGYQGCSKAICFLPQEKNIKVPVEFIKKK
ncbi:MAG: protein-disulfide reductase DsbD N-terminal domain-containing protein [Candidatus Sericytochromatia bacterium]